MKLIEQINLQSEFQSIIDSGYECSIVINDKTQSFTLMKPFNPFLTLSISATISPNKFEESYNKFELFTEIFKEFRTIYNMILELPIKHSTVYLTESADRYILTVKDLYQEPKEPKVLYKKIAYAMGIR